MRRTMAAAALTTLALAAAHTAVADEYWNDAVWYDKAGKRHVELPPVNRSVTPTFPRPPSSWEPPAAGLTHVMEGPEGLVECVTNDYRRDGRCNPYTPGQYRSPTLRVWIVKRSNSWWQCSDARTRNMCERSATQCTGDPQGDRCYPLRPSFNSWLPPAKKQL
jgi:hypothetical protein